jgi:hypothetical protein
MTDKPMTLVERLRNPAYHASGMTRGRPADLDVKRTVADMAEAANEIERLLKENTDFAIFINKLNPSTS